MGSAVLVTRECFLRTGPYREDLLVYYEEVDFCLRARRLGFRPLLVPRAGLYDRLSDMHEAGLLGQLLPEFKRIDCRRNKTVIDANSTGRNFLATHTKRLEKIFSNGVTRFRAKSPHATFRIITA